MGNESHRVFSLGSVLTGLNCIALQLDCCFFYVMDLLSLMYCRLHIIRESSSVAKQLLYPWRPNTLAKTGSW